jgi:DNA-binding GntR family transcriptional regulator
LAGGVVSLTRDAFERIREAIVSGALEFGEPLSETQIAKALGMSKAPVRAAFMESFRSRARMSSLRAKRTCAC